MVLKPTQLGQHDHMTKNGSPIAMNTEKTETSTGMTTPNNYGGSDNSPLLITSHKLNGHNFQQWSQFVMMYMSGKGKDDCLNLLHHQE